MPTHLKAANTVSTLSITNANGQLTLGTWRGIFVREHRHWRGARMYVLHFGH